MCGITTLDDLQLCVRYGADALGFLVRGDDREQSHEPSGHRLDWSAASRLVAAVPHYVASVLLLHVSKRDAIAELCQRINPNVIQIQAEVCEPDLAYLKHHYPHIGLIKTIHVCPESSTDEVVSLIASHLASGVIDGINLDSRKSNASGQTGGTGLTHDWNISASIVKEYKSVPVILAGGLTGGNVRRAVETVQPYAVDVMTGVEAQRGKKSEEKVRAFFAALYKK